MATPGGLVDQPIPGQLSRRGGPGLEKGLGLGPSAYTLCTGLLFSCMGPMPSSCPDQPPPTRPSLPLPNSQTPGCVRGAGSILGPLLIGQSHEASPPHTPHETPGPSVKGGGEEKISTGPAHPPSCLSCLHPTPGLEPQSSDPAGARWVGSEGGAGPLPS